MDIPIEINDEAMEAYNIMKMRFTFLISLRRNSLSPNAFWA